MQHHDVLIVSDTTERCLYVDVSDCRISNVNVPPHSIFLTKLGPAMSTLIR